jgi:predicted transcriptional regulator
MLATFVEKSSPEVLVRTDDGTTVTCPLIDPGCALDDILTIPAGLCLQQIEALFVRIILDSVVAAIPEAVPRSIGCISLGYTTLTFRIGVLQLHLTQQGTSEPSIGILWRPQDTDLTSMGVGPSVRLPGVQRFLREIRSARKNNSKILLKRALEQVLKRASVSAEDRQTIKALVADLDDGRAFNTNHPF